MEKTSKIKIVIFISLVLLLIQVFSPLKMKAADLNWNNPNSGQNPYKFKLSDYLNPKMLTQVVGCTGVVNKVDRTLKDIVSLDKNAIKYDIYKLQIKILNAACFATAGSIESATGAIPTLSLSVTGQEFGDYCSSRKSQDKGNDLLSNISINIQKENQTKDQCLNGIATTLARNQLVAMTKSTINWINTGFNGDPLYVRNMNSFVNSIERDIINSELKMFEGPNSNTDYPYARGFATSTINSRQSSENFAESSKQDLSNYLPEGTSVDDFSNDFSVGGWNGWLALTQHPQNNPLGFNMITSQHIADKQAQEVENTKNQLQTNGGVLDQKVCAKYGTKTIAGTGGLMDMKVPDPDNCIEWETVTPGSLIKDKISTYLNTEVKQLEIADNINSVLNTLFAGLIDKLRVGGLSTIGTTSIEFNNVSGGWGSNTSSSIVDSEGNQYSGSGFSKSRPFDITKDLSNLYIGSNRVNLGKWNANTNEVIGSSPIKKLYLGVSPRDEQDKIVNNGYYEVTVAGKTKLFENGYNAWAIGDRAFWDGESWQNWKKGQANPIAKRGIIQLQQDYIVAATDLLQNLPAVMPKIGELDYCIPGPNPNWQTNSADAYTALTEYVADLKTNYNHRGFLASDYVTIDAPSEDKSGKIYNNYKSIFNGSYLWNGNSCTQSITGTTIYQTIHALATARSDGRWKKNKGLVEVANLRVSDMKDAIFMLLDDFTKDYGKEMTALYENIQKQYIGNELTMTNTINPAWIPMAKDGLGITKNTYFYNDEINTKTRDLNEAIVEAGVNINKLEQIRKEVSKIVQKAQSRRDNKKTDILSQIQSELLKNNPDKNSGWARSVALTTYNQCLTEEDTSYISSNDIMINTNDDESKRCFDGLDNDLDGYIDMDDPDCSGVKKEYVDKQICTLGGTVTKESDDEVNSTTCSNRGDRRTCTGTYYSSGGSTYACVWDDAPITENPNAAPICNPTQSSTNNLQSTSNKR